MAIQTQQELDFEKQLADHEARNASSLEQYKASCASQQISFKGVLDYAASAIRGALLLNGAGAIALMTFMGSGRSTEWHATTLAPALATFAVGAIGAVLSAAASYFSQSFFLWAEASKRKRLLATGLVFQAVGVACFGASIGYFSFGLWRAAKAFNADFSLSSVLGF